MHDFRSLQGEEKLLVEDAVREAAKQYGLRVLD